MRNVFRHSKSFNQDITTWNTANVDKCDDMFYGASSMSTSNMPQSIHISCAKKT